MTRTTRLPARFSALCAALSTSLCAALLAAPVAAQSYTVVVEEWIENVPAGASRFVSPLHEAAERDAQASYGPFRVLDDRTAALVGITDSASPAHLAAMLRAYAIAQGASTQTALFLIAMILFETEPLGISRDLMMVAGWAINIGIAEILIHRAFGTRRSRATVSSTL